MEFRPRAIEPELAAAMGDTPIVVVNGARQVGKTTLVQNLRYRGSVEFVSLDERGSRQAAAADPRSFVRRPVDTLVIDEAQLEPGLFRALKAEVDLDRTPGRFVLTGSSRLLSSPDMASSLVGRVETLDLWPFTQGELATVAERFVDLVFAEPNALLRATPVDRADLVSRLLAGGFPEAVERIGARRSRWFESYLTTIGQTTLRQVSAIERVAEIPRLLRLCAARTASEMNVTSVASEFGVPARTTDGYLALLEDAFLIQRIPAWSTNVSSKVVRRPKIVMTDSGLAGHLLGASAQTVDSPQGSIGPLLETFVAGELRRQIGWSQHRPSLWHFRDRSGVEVDLVLEHPDGRIVGVEVKATSTPTQADLKGLRFLADRLGARFQFGVVLSTSSDAIPFGPRMAALPVSSLWRDWS